MPEFAPQQGDLIFHGFQIATMTMGATPYGLIPNAMLIVRGDAIMYVGAAVDPDRFAAGISLVRGNQALITPGLIDCHTHLVFAGDRTAEFARRVQGTTYESIAREGGGILATVRATREASHDQLFFDAHRRLALWLRQGVTTIEIKSGYGLNLETERKQLLVAKELARHSPIEVVTTLLAAHAVPPEFAGRAKDYIDYVCSEVIPSTTDLASAVDVFCESIGFDVCQTRQVLETGLEYGLQLKVHAEQLSNTGGATLASELGALSADHLEYLQESGVEALACHETVATLLPGAYYFLQLPQRPPVDLLRKHGVPMALATDFNPGSSPISSVFWILNMACLLYGLTPEEALLGMTRNAAKALGMDDRVGTIERGKQADFVIWDVPSPDSLVCALTDNPCKSVYKRGELCYAASL